MVRSRISCFKRRLVFVCVVPLLFLGMCQTYVFGGLAPVEKTGQITSYSATGGEDGDLQKGVKWPKPRFKDNGNGTVTDRLTKLIWLKNANAFGERTWEQALSDANTLASGSAGLTDGSVAGDWRLPNVKELQSLIDFAYDNPAPLKRVGNEPVEPWECLYRRAVELLLVEYYLLGLYDERVVRGPERWPRGHRR